MKRLLASMTIAAMVFSLVPSSMVFAEENTATKVMVDEPLPKVARMQRQEGATIILDEVASDSWQEGEEFVLRLPSDMVWTSNTRVNGVRVSTLNIDGRLLTVKPRVTSGLDSVVIDTNFDIPRNASLGLVEVSFTKGPIDTQNVTIEIAEISDYAVKMSAPKQNLKFGDIQPKNITVTIEEVIPGSIIANTNYEMVLEGATFDKDVQIRSIVKEGNRTLSTSFNEGAVSFRTNTVSADKSAWEISFTIIPEKEHIGDITLNLQGREVSEEIVLFVVEETVGLNVTTPTSVALGRQNQAIPNITIRETVAGGLPRGTHAIEISPEYSGLRLTDTEIDVLEGNVEVSDVRIEGNKIYFNVTNASTRPSAIVLNGTRASIDQFGIEGPYTATFILNDGQSNEARDGSSVLFNVVAATPVPGTGDFVAQFVIDNPTFTKVTSGISTTQTFDTAPYIENGRTMLSVAAAGLALDAQVSYEADTRKVTVISGTDRAEMIIGDNIMLINGEEIEMDTAPVIRNNRTFLPIAYLGQALGADVEWVAASRTVILTKN